MPDTSNRITMTCPESNFFLRFILQNINIKNNMVMNARITILNEEANEIYSGVVYINWLKPGVRFDTPPNGHKMSRIDLPFSATIN